MEIYANDCDEPSMPHFFWSTVCLCRGNWKAEGGESVWRTGVCHELEWCHLHAAATIKLFWFNAANMSSNYADVLAWRQWHAIINSQQLVLTPHISRSRLSIQLRDFWIIRGETLQFDKSPTAAAVPPVYCAECALHVNKLAPVHARVN